VPETRQKTVNAFAVFATAQHHVKHAKIPVWRRETVV